jgi:hypothetical protein
MSDQDQLQDISPQELAWTVQYGLHRKNGYEPSDAETLGIQIIADRLIEHFRAAGLVIKKKCATTEGFTNSITSQRKN